MTLLHACRQAGIGMVTASEHVGAPRLHRAVPALSARLVISLGAPIDVHYDGQTHRSQAVAAGLMRPGIATPVLTLRPDQPTVYVELSLPAMQRLTGVPLGQMDARGVDVDDLLPWVRQIGAQLASCPAEQRAWLVRARLLEQMNRAEPHAVPRDALESLVFLAESGGRVSVDELARRAHLSPRQLRHVMRRALGIGPKLASRIARLNTAIGRAGDGAASWAQIAAESGYHDQSHLVRDFHDLMRTTPSAWLAEERRNLQGWRRPSS